MMKRKLLMVMLFAFLINFLSFASELLQGREAVELLKAGGLVVYMRHAATNHDQDDLFPVTLSDCSTQRNLNSIGVSQSKNIYKVLTSNNIEIGTVESSPFCRCVDTAFNATGVEPDVNLSLYFAVGIGEEERARQSEVLKTMLATVPEGRSNNFIVSHTANLKEATGIWPKPEGVAYLFKPDGKGGFTAVGVITPDEWQSK